MKGSTDNTQADLTEEKDKRELENNSYIRNS